MIKIMYFIGLFTSVYLSTIAPVFNHVDKKFSERFVWLIVNNNLPINKMLSKTIIKYPQIINVDLIKGTNIVIIEIKVSDIKKSFEIEKELMLNYLDYIRLKNYENSDLIKSNFTFKYCSDNFILLKQIKNGDNFIQEINITLSKYNRNTIESIPYILKSKSCIASHMDEFGLNYGTCEEFRYRVECLYNMIKSCEVSDDKIKIEIISKNKNLLNNMIVYLKNLMEEIYNSKNLINETYLRRVDSPFCYVESEKGINKTIITNSGNQ